MRDVKAVLFDVDGTLVDSMDMLIAGLGDGFEHASGTRPHEDFLRSLMGRSLRDQMKLAAPHADPESLERLEAHTISRYNFHSDKEKPYLGAQETLKLFHGCGIRTCLVTSKNTTEVNDFLNRFPFRHYIDATVSASDVANPKPAPDSARLACERLNVESQNAIFIGDSLWDLRCAKAAGIPFVAVSYGAADKATLQAESPELLFETPEELLAWARAEMSLTCHEKK